MELARSSEREAPTGMAAIGLALRTLRARQWWYFALLPAARLPRVFAIGESASALAGGVAIAAAALGFAYGLNAISDRATDEDPRKNPLARGAHACPREVTVAVALSGVIALALAAAVGPPSLWAAGTSLGAAIVYSIGPRWKSVPLVGTLLNAAIFAPLLVVAPLGRALPPPSVTLGFVALLLQNQLLHERADAEEDRAAGVATTAAWLGPRGLRAALAAIGLAGALAAILLASTRAQAGVALAGCALATAAALRKGSPRAVRAAHRRTAFLVGAALFAASFLG